MPDPSNSFRARLKAKPFAVWVIFAALLYVGLAIIPVAAQFSAGSSVAIVVPFIIIPILAAVVVLQGKRWSFAVAAVVSVIFLLLFGSYSPGVLANPGDPSFWFAISTLPVLLLAAIFAILALASTKGGIEGKPFLASPKSTGGLLTFAVIGFVIGAVVTGTLAGGSSAGCSPAAAWWRTSGSCKARRARRSRTAPARSPSCTEAG